jgi:hypothetical protein
MSNSRPNSAEDLRQREKALSQWDTEGGAGPCGPQDNSNPDEEQTLAPMLTNGELVQLRIRVIALENLVIALLSEGSELQHERAREMATYILPRPDFTSHPLTIKAANQMTSLVDRALQFRLSPS